MVVPSIRSRVFGCGTLGHARAATPHDPADRGVFRRLTTCCSHRRWQPRLSDTESFNPKGLEAPSRPWRPVSASVAICATGRFFDRRPIARSRFIPFSPMWNLTGQPAASLAPALDARRSAGGRSGCRSLRRRSDALLFRRPDRAGASVGAPRAAGFTDFSGSREGRDRRVTLGTTCRSRRSASRSNASASLLEPLPPRVSLFRCRREPDPLTESSPASEILASANVPSSGRWRRSPRLSIARATSAIAGS